MNFVLEMEIELSSLIAMEISMEKFNQPSHLPRDLNMPALGAVWRASRKPQSPQKYARQTLSAFCTLVKIELNYKINFKLN